MLRHISIGNKKVSTEDLSEKGFMDDRDVDYLDHLDIPDAELTPTDEVAMEGIARALVHDSASTYTDVYREVKGYFLGATSKQKYIEEICVDLIDWLDEKNADYKNLDLDMGSFKTWMKTSETLHWRFYFLLNDSTWSKIEADLKSGKISALETLYDVNYTDRKSVTDNLDSITNINGLINIVKKYADRSNKFFELIKKRKVTIKMAPFQVILLGATDLRRTAKKIVNLAI